MLKRIFEWFVGPILAIWSASFAKFVNTFFERKFLMKFLFLKIFLHQESEENFSKYILFSNILWMKIARIWRQINQF